MNQLTKAIVLSLLRGYKLAVSPILQPACRYVPSCSDYALEAVDRFGVRRGSVMAMRRVIRCHPFAASGYDPVLDPKTGATVRSGE